MEENFYKSIIENAPLGCATFEIVYNNNGAPCDYRFLDINSKFEQLTNSKAVDVKGRLFSEVGAALGKEEIDRRIAEYAKIAIEGGEQTFEYTTPDGKEILRTHAISPQKGYFTLFAEKIKTNT